MDKKEKLKKQERKKERKEKRREEKRIMSSKWCKPGVIVVFTKFTYKLSRVLIDKSFNRYTFLVIFFCIFVWRFVILEVPLIKLWSNEFQSLGPVKLKVLLANRVLVKGKCKEFDCLVGYLWMELFLVNILENTLGSSLLQYLYINCPKL